MTDHDERGSRGERESGTNAEQAGEEFLTESDAADPLVDEDPEALEALVETEAGALRQQLAEQRDRYLRLAAEYDNFRKRAVRERTDAMWRGQAELTRQIIESLDDLARFAHLDPAATDAATVVEGAALVERKLLKSLGTAGLELVDPVGQTFDPNVHEAVATEPAASREDDHVVSRVFQVGYLFNGQLLRPARVVVKQWNG